MAKYGRVTKEKLVLEVCELDPAKCFHPDIAKEFVSVPDDAEAGDTIKSGKAVKPEAPKEAPKPPAEDKLLVKEQFDACLTRAQRIALKKLGESDDEVKDLLEQMTTSNHINIDDQENKDLLARLVTDKVIDQAALDKVNAHKS
ncbi:MAG TPA: hypothetical protein DCX77_05955 [Acidimicrobiaceae bacterium]|nr:hypothetical protein [Acidimicrobiaceae bacterium]|tara:strand:- start:917 stop:1348 length:432 start_codon:yes stop_codon:yes gene_type:complete